MAAGGAAAPAEVEVVVSDGEAPGGAAETLSARPRPTPPSGQVVGAPAEAGDDEPESPLSPVRKLKTDRLPFDSDGTPWPKRHLIGESEGSRSGPSPKPLPEECSTPGLWRPMEPLREPDAVPVHAASEIEQMYEKMEELGQGGFAVVYKVRAKSDGKLYAMKTFKAGKPETGHDFLNKKSELDIFKRLNHRNVISLHATFLDETDLYLVMDLCTGGDLVHFFQHYWSRDQERREMHRMAMRVRGNGLPDFVVGRLLYQMLAGVGYLHYHRIVHRDVKLENFILRSDAEDAQLALIDFGLSCRLERGARLTKRVGTVEYMAPEALSGTYDEKVDVWGVGATAFALAAGCQAFGEEHKEGQEVGKVREQTIEDILAHRLNKNEAHWANVQKELRAIILKQLLETDGERRPAAKKVVKDSKWLQQRGADEEPCCCAVL